MRNDYVIFWGDNHHPVRVLPIRLREEDLALGSRPSVILNRYCVHLQGLGLGQRVTWGTSDDCRGSYPALLAQDLRDFHNWMAKEGVEL